MPKPLKKTKNNPTDSNLLARSVIEAAIGELLNTSETVRQGGLKGGRARAQALSAEKRKSIAKKAAKARWSPT